MVFFKMLVRPKFWTNFPTPTNPERGAILFVLCCQRYLENYMSGEHIPTTHGDDTIEWQGRVEEQKIEEFFFYDALWRKLH